MSKINNISIDEIKQYMRCPLAYKLYNVDKIKSPLSLQETFDKNLRQCVMFFYYSILNEGRILTEDQFKKKWEGLCKIRKDQTGLQYILTPSRDAGGINYIYSDEKREKEMAIKGWIVLKNFYRDFINNPGYPIVLDLEYEVLIDNVWVTGKIDLVRTVEDNKEELVLTKVIHSKGKTISQYILDTSIDISLEVYAFRKMFRQEENRIEVYFTDSREIMQTSRNQNDMQRMGIIINNIYEGISRQIYYPRDDTSCQFCKSMQYCKMWKGE